MAKIANVALSNTFDTWRTRSNQAFDRLSQFAINNSSLYANTITANVAFASLGSVAVGTTLTVTGNTTVQAMSTAALTSSSANIALGFGFASNAANFTTKKIRNFTEDAKSYRNSSTSITVDSNRNVQRITLTGNATVTLPASMPGQTESVKTIVLQFKQDGTGGRSMTLAAPGGEALVFNNSASQPAVATGASKVTIFVCTKFDGDTNWYVSMSFIQA